MVKVRGKVEKADVLALTAENGKTLYTLGGLRWGIYHDIERRAPDYTLPPFTQTGKRFRAYIQAYLNGELDLSRKATVKYAEHITAEQVETQKKRQEELKQMTAQYRYFDDLKLDKFS